MNALLHSFVKILLKILLDYTIDNENLFIRSRLEH